MIRPIELIVAAILLCRPSLPEADATRYAKVLSFEARRQNFDPLTGVAIIQHESGWTPRLVSDDGEDFGLAQIRARYVGACKGDLDPLGSPSAACREVQSTLLDPDFNIRQMAATIALNRQFCLRRTGRRDTAAWIASYQGLNFPSQKTWCRPGKPTWEVLELQEKLVAYAQRRSAKHKAPSHPSPRKTHTSRSASHIPKRH